MDWFGKCFFANYIRRDAGEGVASGGCNSGDGGRVCGSSVVWCGADWSLAGEAGLSGGGVGAARLAGSGGVSDIWAAAVVLGCDVGGGGFAVESLYVAGAYSAGGHVQPGRQDGITA